MAIPLLAMLAGGAGAGSGGLASLLGGGGGAGFAGVGSQFATPGLAGSVNGMPMVSSMASGGSPAFWQQFSQMYGSGAAPGGHASPQQRSSNPFTDKLGQGSQLITAYLDNLENRTGRLSEMVRGPTMPFLPKLNTSQVGPNINPGQIGLAQLLAQIATRRG